MAVRFLEHRSRTAAATGLADQVGTSLKSALQSAGEASLVVSGGTSPAGLFAVLAATPLPWRHVHVVPSDERRVPVDHPDSNYGMIGHCLLNGPAEAAQLVSLLPEDDDLEPVEQRLGALPRPFAHVVLGMGSDGHTASLFPTSPDIAEALASDRRCIAQEVPGQAQRRISLTLKALLDSDRISLLLFGAEKREVLERAMTPGPVRELPVRGVLHQERIPVTVHWAA